MKPVNPVAETLRNSISRRRALALLAAAASVAGIYGCSDTSGNASQSISPELAEALKPFLKGDVAAMGLRDTPEDIGALTFNGPDGNPMTFAQTGEKLRLVNLWATWCAPCREEMPYLDTLQAARGGADFEVIAISVDGGSDEKPRAFFAEIGMKNLEFYHDPTIGVFNTLKKQTLAFGLPVTLLVGADNRVIAAMNGPAHWAGDDALALVDKALEATANGPES